MNKLIKLTCVASLVAFSVTPCFAGFKEHFDLGQQYLTN